MYTFFIKKRPAKTIQLGKARGNETKYNGKKTKKV